MLIIGVSTEQNTTNLIPAVQVGAKRFLIVETSHANRQGWSRGMEEVLAQRGISLQKIILSPEEDTHIRKIYEKIDQVIDKESSVIFNIGGGQKPQQLALWQLFLNRSFEGRQDKVCYANQSGKPLIEWWAYKDEELQNIENIPINVDLSAEEILTTFGFRVMESKPIYHKKKNFFLQTSTPDYLAYSVWREFLFRLAMNNVVQLNEQTTYNINQIRTALMNKKAQITEKLREKTQALFPKDELINKNTLINLMSAFSKEITERIIPTALLAKSSTPSIKIDDVVLAEKLKTATLQLNADQLKKLTGYDRYSYYYEQIFMQRMVDLFKKISNHAVNEAHANIKIEKTSYQGNVTAEYDVLLVTQFGTLIALDAKTFDFDNKDSDARWYNLQQAAGRYVNFIAVLPINEHDWDKDFLPERMKSLIFRLHRRNTRFFVINDANNQDFTVTEETEGNEKLTIKCVNLVNLFKELKLIV